MKPEFISFAKMPRLNRKMIVTEKLDGTNAQVFISEEGEIYAGSRNQWITPYADNYGFAGWVERNKAELLKLGPGRHFGEWWGSGIQRRYGMQEKVFSLFNVSRWVPQEFATGLRFEYSEQQVAPSCCRVVPVLYRGDFNQEVIQACVDGLRKVGSAAAPGFPHPEGVVVYHVAADACFKVTLENDEQRKPAYATTV